MDIASKARERGAGEGEGEEGEGAGGRGIKGRAKTGMEPTKRPCLERMASMIALGPKRRPEPEGTLTPNASRRW